MPEGNFIMTFVIFGGMFALMYLMVIVPDKKRRKKYSQLIDSLKVSDMVTTKGGIVGKIVNIQENHMILETGPDRARIKMLKTGVFTVDSAVEITEK